MALKRKYLQLQAIKFGVISAVIGCAVFVIVEQMWLILKFGPTSFDSKVDFEIAVMIFIFGSILASLLTIVSSSVLALILYNDALKHTLSFPKVIQRGILTGIITGVGVFIVEIILTSGRGSTGVFLLDAIEVVVIASIGGGWTGKKLANYIFPHSEILSENTHSGVS